MKSHITFWMLSKVPPNGDSLHCFWYEHTKTMKFVKHSLDAVYTACGIYHSYFGLSTIFSPFIVPLLGFCALFRQFSMKQCNRMMAFPDLQIIQVIWKLLLDSSVSYYVVQKVFPFMGITTELKVVERFSIKLT
eukprot:UN10796